MKPARLQRLVAAVRATAAQGHSLELALRAEVFAHRLSPDDERQLREEAVKQERIEAEKNRVRAALVSNTCPLCGSQVKRNLALTGWVQCSQFGAEQFRADPKHPPCSWQGFI